MVKDTILKAIHNMVDDEEIRLRAVFQWSKIQFWKQFTTDDRELFNFNKLYFNGQRYNFESNSQLVAPGLAIAGRCISMVKDTILKAIHN